MQAKPSNTHAWQWSVDALRRPGTSPARNTAARPRYRDVVQALHEPGDDCTVRVIERITSRTVRIEWCDPTSCRYGHQIWYAGRAKKDGTCALSRQAVRRGDAVYRPALGKPRPRNAGATILAELISLFPLDA